MLPYNRITGVPVCPACGQELHEIFVKRFITSYLVFDKETRNYVDARRENICDDNVFHCAACNAPISSKELFETLVCLAQNTVALHTAVKQ